MMKEQANGYGICDSTTKDRARLGHVVHVVELGYTPPTLVVVSIHMHVRAVTPVQLRDALWPNETMVNGHARKRWS